MRSYDSFSLSVDRNLPTKAEWRMSVWISIRYRQSAFFATSGADGSVLLERLVEIQCGFGIFDELKSLNDERTLVALCNALFCSIVC